MKGSTIGTLTSAIGYLLAISGGWILYRNAAPEVGAGRIPIIEGGNMAKFFEEQDQQIEGRRWGNKVGFALLTLGSCLQLVGTLMSGLSN